VSINQTLEVVDWALSLIQNDMVMDGASGTLNGRMGVQVEVVLERMSDITLHKSTRNGVAVLITSNIVSVLGEEADMVTLASNSACS
jgi:hypothetical protein